MGRSVRLTRSRHRDHLHWPGVIFVLLTLLIGGAALQRGESLLIWVFASLLAWILVSGVISGWMMLGVRARRIAPSHGEVGRALRLRYEVSSLSRLWPIFDLRIVESGRTECEPATVMHCGIGEQVVAECTCVPTGRGRLELTAMRAKSGFPFGLLLKSVESVQRDEIIVHPTITPLRGDALQRLFAGRGGEGRSASAVRGAGEEFHGLREFRSGDALRAVAWRRSASREALVVIERSAPAPRRLALALDLRMTDPPHTREQEEVAIAMTASLLHNGQRSGWEVGLRVIGVNHTPSTMLSSRRHLVELLDQLALIDLDRARTREGLERSRSSASSIVIHPGEPRALAAPSDALCIAATTIKSLHEVTA